MGWLELLGIACMWLVALVKAPAALRQPRQRALWAAITTIAVAMTLRLDGVDVLLQRVLGDAHTIDLARQVFATADSAALLCFVFLASGRSRYVLRILSLAAVVAGVLLYIDAVSPPHARNVVGEDGPLPVYWIIYFSVLFVSDLTCATVCWYNGRRADERPLRLGLTTFAAGLALACVLWVLFAVYLVTGWEPAEQLLSPVTGVEALFLAAGVLVASSGSLLRPVHSLLTLRRLTPLWRDISLAVPSVVLVPPSRGLTAPGMRIYRMVIEIRDGLLVLRNYVPPALLRRAREHVAAQGVPQEQADAAVTACWVATAIASRGAGAQPQPEPPRIAHLGGGHLDTEIDFLRELARAYRSPLVTEFRRQQA
ncbi:hypothetical protein GCM10010174_77750 [Kutzneria viridogrisea]|uniref:DUF6545 domain-containing protein n=1 Tax=Kutzneria viridogrisea TaxID=47990 RepID=A0ABR6BJY9_9PSEU|nr:hypothetical protein [Kutzneria viridogrisea]